jgi:hypothetical protein
MEQLISSPVELRLRGFAALEARLGWVNAVRFLQLFDPGMGDYTEERSQPRGVFLPRPVYTHLSGRTMPCTQRVGSPAPFSG